MLNIIQRAACVAHYVTLCVSHAFRFSKSNYIIKLVHLRAKIKEIREWLTNRKYLLVGKLFEDREKVTIIYNINTYVHTLHYS